MPTVRHTRRPSTKTAKAQTAPTGAPKPTRAPSTPKKAPKPAKPPTAKAASSRPSRAPTKKPARRSNTKAATASKPPVKAAKPPAKPTRFWRALGLSAAGVAAAAGLYAAYRKRGTLMAAVQPVLQRMTPAEKARFVEECNAKGVKGKTAKGVVKGVDKGRGKASDKAADPVPGIVAAVVTVLIALVLTVSYAKRCRIRTRDLKRSDIQWIDPRIETPDWIGTFNKLNAELQLHHIPYSPPGAGCVITNETTYKQELKDWKQKNFENEIIKWKRRHPNDSFYSFIYDNFPENIKVKPNTNIFL